MKNLIMLLLIIIGIFLVGCSSTPTGGAVVDTEESVKIPISEVSKKLDKYSFNAGGVNVNYFVVKGKDGKIRTAFDACDVCGGYKGYFQKGDDVVCNNCGRFFSIDEIGTKNRPGGCWPSFLNHRIEEGYVVIDKAELARGAFRFA